MRPYLLQEHEKQCRAGTVKGSMFEVRAAPWPAMTASRRIGAGEGSVKDACRGHGCPARAACTLHAAPQGRPGSQMRRLARSNFVRARRITTCGPHVARAPRPAGPAWCLAGSGR